MISPIISRQRSYFRLAMLSLLCAGVSGCGGAYDATVSGVVTFDGDPLSRGTIAYDPVQAGPRCYGLIQQDGSYDIMTGREEGLPPGEYKVTVVANEESTPNPKGGPPAPGKPISPAWYRTKSSTPLTYTVEAGSNEIDVSLTSEPPAGWNTKNRRRRR